MKKINPIFIGNNSLLGNTTTIDECYDYLKNKEALAIDIETTRKYYKYEDANYSITNSPISNQDLSKLSEAVSFLKQFQGFSHFNELGSMVQKLEDHIYTQKTHEKPLIDFEKNEHLKGLEFLDTLYQFILKKQAIEITYQSFKARQESTFIFYPYLLKEFRNRWFVLGKKTGGKGILNLALDRIVAVDRSSSAYEEAENFDPSTYFHNVLRFWPKS